MKCIPNMLFLLVAPLTLAMALGVPDHGFCSPFTEKGVGKMPYEGGAVARPHSCPNSGWQELVGCREGAGWRDGLLQPEPLLSQKQRHALS